MVNFNRRKKDRRKLSQVGKSPSQVIRVIRFDASSGKLLDTIYSDELAAPVSDTISEAAKGKSLQPTHTKPSGPDPSKAQ